MHEISISPFSTQHFQRMLGTSAPEICAILGKEILMGYA
jgi:hypothetical protein